MKANPTELVSVVIGLLHYMRSSQKWVVQKPKSTEASSVGLDSFVEQLRSAANPKLIRCSH
jgi:hypothetical protein